MTSAVNTTPVYGTDADSELVFYRPPATAPFTEFYTAIKAIRVAYTAVADNLLRRHRHDTAEMIKTSNDTDVSQHFRNRMIDAARLSISNGDFIVLKRATDASVPPVPVFVYNKKCTTSSAEFGDDVDTHFGAPTFGPGDPDYVLPDDPGYVGKDDGSESGSDEGDKSGDDTTSDDDDAVDLANKLEEGAKRSSRRVPVGDAARPVRNARPAAKRRRNNDADDRDELDEDDEPAELYDGTGYYYAVAAGGFTKTGGAGFFGNRNLSVVPYTEDLHTELFTASGYTPAPVNVMYTMLINELRKKRDGWRTEPTGQDDMDVDTGDSMRSEYLTTLPLRMTPDALTRDFSESMNAIHDCLVSLPSAGVAYHSWNLRVVRSSGATDNVYIAVNSAGYGQGKDIDSSSRSFYEVYSVYDDQTKVMRVDFHWQEYSGDRGLLFTLKLDDDKPQPNDVEYIFNKDATLPSSWDSFQAIALPRNGSGFVYEGIDFNQPVYNKDGLQYLSRHGQRMEMALATKRCTSRPEVAPQLRTNAWGGTTGIPNVTVRGDGVVREKQRVDEASDGRERDGICKSATSIILAMVCDSLRTVHQDMLQSRSMAMDVRDRITTFMSSVNSVPETYFRDDVEAAKQYKLIPIEPSDQWTSRNTSAVISFDTVVHDSGEDGATFVWCNTSPTTRLDAFEAAIAYAYCCAIPTEAAPTDFISVRVAADVQNAREERLVRDARAAVATRYAQETYMFRHLFETTKKIIEQTSTDDRVHQMSILQNIIKRCFMLGQFAETLRTVGPQTDETITWIEKASLFAAYLSSMIENNTLNSGNRGKWEQTVMDTFAESNDPEEKSLLTKFTKFVFDAAVEDYEARLNDIPRDNGKDLITSQVHQYVTLMKYVEFTPGLQMDDNTKRNIVSLIRNVIVEMVNSPGAYTTAWEQFNTQPGSVLTAFKDCCMFIPELHGQITQLGVGDKDKIAISLDRGNDGDDNNNIHDLFWGTEEGDGDE